MYAEPAPLELQAAKVVSAKTACAILGKE